MSKENEVIITSEPVGNTTYTLYTSIDLTLFSCDLKGVYDYRVLPDDKITKILVMPTDTEPHPMKLTQMIADINNIIVSFGGGEEVSADDMKETLNSMGLSVLEDIGVEMRQLFLFLETSTKNPDKKSCEYAFNFVITNDVTPDDSFSLFKFKKLSFAVYNTERNKIIERMDLEDIDELLA